MEASVRRTDEASDFAAHTAVCEVSGRHAVEGTMTGPAGRFVDVVRDGDADWCLVFGFGRCGLAGERRGRNAVLAGSEGLEIVEVFGEGECAGWGVLKKIEEAAALLKHLRLVHLVYVKLFEGSLLVAVRCLVNKSGDLALRDRRAELDTGGKEFENCERVLAFLR